MASIKFAKHKLIRNAIRDLIQPLKVSGVVSKVFLYDAEITNKKHFPAICIFFEDGKSEHIVDDFSKPKMTTAYLNIKFKCDIQDDEVGEGVLDDIADKVGEILDADLMLGGLLDDDLEMNDFSYTRGENQLYSSLTLNSEIQFYQ